MKTIYVIPNYQAISPGFISLSLFATTILSIIGIVPILYSDIFPACQFTAFAFGFLICAFYFVFTLKGSATKLSVCKVFQFSKKDPQEKRIFAGKFLKTFETAENYFYAKKFIEKVFAQKNSNKKVFVQKSLSRKVFKENDLNKMFCAKKYESCFGRFENRGTEVNRGNQMNIHNLIVGHTLVCPVVSD